MSTVLLSEARARPGISLPADDLVAQDIIDEQEAWLARRVGQLTGSRTETFFVGLSATHGKLALGRYTDAVAVADNGVTIDPSRIVLIDSGSAVLLGPAELTPWWQGPYVGVTYEPNDLDLVRKAIFDLLALTSTPVSGLSSEQIGSYSYSTGQAGGSAVASTIQARALIASALLPKRDQLGVIRAVSRRVAADDPVINRPEARD